MKIKNISIFPNFNKKYSYNYNVYYNLKKHFGLNYSKTFRLCNNLGFNKKSQLKYNNKYKIQLLNLLLQKRYNVNKLYILKYLYFMIKWEVNIKSMKGLRHLKNLPVHGQRTHTNRDTQKHLNRYSFLKNIFENIFQKKNVNINTNKSAKDKKKIIKKNK